MHMHINIDKNTHCTGTLELCIRHLLIRCITVDKLFSLRLLNDRLNSFCYGAEINNKPSPLSAHHVSVYGHLKQSGKGLLLCLYNNAISITNYCSLTASQMWCLGRFLPILVGDVIPEGYKCWENYLTHLDIMEEVFAPVTSVERMDYD